ncbi:MAG: hypothetical protein ACR2MN_13370 [Acidimicrobiales bacterium]
MASKALKKKILGKQSPSLRAFDVTDVISGLDNDPDPGWWTRPVPPTSYKIRARRNKGNRLVFRVTQYSYSGECYGNVGTYDTRKAAESCVDAMVAEFGPDSEGWTPELEKLWHDPSYLAATRATAIEATRAVLSGISADDVERFAQRTEELVRAKEAGRVAKGGDKGAEVVLRRASGQRRSGESGGLAGEDTEITCFDMVLETIGVSDADALVSTMNDQTDDAAWIDLENSTEEDLIICVGQIGTVLGYPFQVCDFWDTLLELNAQVNTMDAWDCLDNEIEAVEGFKVFVDVERLPSGSYRSDPLSWRDDPPPNVYPYRRAASGEMTVSAWVEKRFRRYYRDYDIEIYCPDGSRARGNVLLKTLRQSWRNV